MKKFVWIPVLSVVLAMMAAPVLAGQTLRVVGTWSNLTLYKNLELPFWTQTAPEVLGGDIKTIMTSLDQVNLSGAQVVRQVDAGVFDVAHTVVDYLISDNPELAGLDMPALAMDSKMARKVVDAYRPVLDKVLQDSFKVKLLAVTHYPAQILFSNVDIKSLKDLKGKKVRGSGWSTLRFITALGAASVDIAFPEVPQSLQRGVADAAITGGLSGYNAGWGDVTKYIYPLPIGGWDYVISVISLKIWNGLSREKQEKLQALILEKMEKRGWAVADEEDQMGISCLTGSKKCPRKPANLQLIEVNPTDVKLARQILAEQILPAWAAEVGPEAVSRWNTTIGTVVGLKAKTK